jgi:hypothetical protein
MKLMNQRRVMKLRRVMKKIQKLKPHLIPLLLEEGI